MKNVWSSLCVARNVDDTLHVIVNIIYIISTEDYVEITILLFKSTLLDKHNVYFVVLNLIIVVVYTCRDWTENMWLLSARGRCVFRPYDNKIVPMWQPLAVKEPFLQYGVHKTVVCNVSIFHFFDVFWMLD